MAVALTALKARDLRKALTVVRALADDSTDRHAFVPNALDRLAELVPSELTTLSLCDLERGTRTVFGRRGEALSEADIEAFNRHFREHPLVRFHSSTPHGPTQRVSDCQGRSDFASSAVYADYYSRIGIRHVMALPLRIDDRNVISIVFNRSTSDFRDSERAVLEAVRPALAAFYRSLVAREEAGIALESISDLATNAGWHLVRVTVAGRIKEAAPAARRLLANFFPDGGGAFLPVTLRVWLGGQRNWGLDRLPTRDGRHFVASRLGLRLSVQAIVEADGTVALLLLRAERRSVDAADLQVLALTRREREVLAFVAGGKANADIAAILGISARTVQKHLEHIFAKLGVETRTAAAVRALTAADVISASALAAQPKAP
jgi:DNA-binding CsgD family transcriptional regulator